MPLFLVHARIFHIYLPFHCLLKIPTPGQLQPRCQVKLCADHTHFYLREGPFGNVLKKKLRTVVLIVQPINKDETYPNSLTPHAGMDGCMFVCKRVDRRVAIVWQVWVLVDGVNVSRGAA